jgi:integrase-like protein
MSAILRAANDYPSRAKALKLRALVLLMRFSGLRISDAVTLSAERISRDGRLFLYTQKTGAPVWLPLPPVVLEALAAIPAGARSNSGRGASKPKTAVGLWETDLAQMFKLAGLPGGHAQRFRDTFAFELLLQGVLLERVSILLGHQSVKITEQHYSPWVHARQTQLEADVRRTWDSDLLATETKGTPEVHGESGRVNWLENKGTSAKPEGGEGTDGGGNGTWELAYYKLYQSQIPVIKQAIDTAADMLGSDKSRGYCLEMIYADFLTGGLLGQRRPVATAPVHRKVLQGSSGRWAAFLRAVGENAAWSEFDRNSAGLGWLRKYTIASDNGCAARWMEMPRLRNKIKLRGSPPAI